ncbi:DUF3784 domain-containing protein [Sporosarcina gallistercoris]|uniref:DUF3784 domain-containing protein n=1 Tax=Sporosarcina gallistercoris TaxID=2762245 RepID=UPI003D28F332
MIILALTIIVFFGLGTLFLKGKGASLIAGYNTMTKEEKEQYDRIRLCKFMGKMMYVFSLSMVLWGLSDFLDETWLLYAGLALFLSTVFFMIVYMNTGNRFQKTTSE